MKVPRLNEEQRQLLVELYERTGLTVDELPYTEAYERLFATFLQRTGLNLDRHTVWRLLASQRKSTKLPHKQR